MSPATGNAAAIGVGTLAKSCNSSDRATATVQQSPEKVEGQNDNPVGHERSDGGAGVSVLASSARAVAAAEKGRWSDLDTWLNCSLTALEACTRCVNWTSSVGYVGGLAYVRLFSLVLRLLCPLTAAAEGGDGEDAADDADRLFFGGGVFGDGKTLDDGRTPGGERGRLGWARPRLAQVVDDLMWRLREGLPGRDIRLRLLQVCNECMHFRCVYVAVEYILSGTYG